MRERKRHIKGGTFAAVIHAYMASPKYAGLADNTQQSYRRSLALAELPGFLGAYCVEEIRPSVVQLFLVVLGGLGLFSVIGAWVELDRIYWRIKNRRAERFWQNAIKRRT